MATLKATVICVVDDVLFRFRVTMETDSPTPTPPCHSCLLSMELIPHSCMYVYHTHTCTRTHTHTHTHCPPSTPAPPGLGRSEKSEEALEWGGIVGSGLQGCGFKCCLCLLLCESHNPVQLWVSGSASGNLRLLICEMKIKYSPSPHGFGWGASNSISSGREPCELSKTLRVCPH